MTLCIFVKILMGQMRLKISAYSGCCHRLNMKGFVVSWNVVEMVKHCWLRGVQEDFLGRERASSILSVLLFYENVRKHSIFTWRDMIASVFTSWEYIGFNSCNLWLFNMFALHFLHHSIGTQAKKYA